MNKLIIFDFEGTIVNFQWKLKEAVDKVFDILDVFCKKDNISLNYQGMRNYAQIYNLVKEQIKDKVLNNKLMEEINKIYDFYDKDASFRWNLYPETKEMLTILKEKNFFIALDSNVGRKALDFMLEKFDIKKFFDITISRNEVNFLKPNPEGIFLILNKFKNIKFKGKYFVGDSISDIKTAKDSNKNFKIISVVNGEDDIQKLMEYKPDLIITPIKDQFPQFPSFIEFAKSL